LAAKERKEHKEKNMKMSEGGEKLAKSISRILMIIGGVFALIAVTCLVLLAYHHLQLR